MPSVSVRGPADDVLTLFFMAATAAGKEGIIFSFFSSDYDFVKAVCDTLGAEDFIVSADKDATVNETTVARTIQLNFIAIIS